MPAGSSQSAHGEGAHSAPATPLPSQPSTDPPHALPDDDLPYPPRFWWLKRLSIASGMLFVVLILLRLWWGWEANRRLQAEIAKYRAAGEPVFAEEFDAALDAVPPEENAALLYEQAINAMVGTTPSGLMISDIIDKVIASRLDDARELARLNAQAYSLVEQAATRSRAAWKTRLANYFKIAPAANLSQYRVLSRLLYLKGYLAVLQGNLQEALSVAGLMLHFNRSVRATPILIDSLVAWATDSMAYQLIRRTAVAYMTSRSGPGSLTNAPDRSTVSDWITRLLDETTLREQFELTARGERSFLFQFLKEGPVLDFSRFSFLPVNDTAARVIAWPIFAMNAVEQAHSYAAAYEAPLGADANVEIQLGPDPAPTFLSGLARPWAYASHARNTRIIQLQNLAQRRMAALSLAIALFVRERGKYPSTLQELVPDYIPLVPLDLMSRNCDVIRYDPAQEPPCIYSVGRNGIDEGGKTHPDGDDVVFKLGPDSIADSTPASQSPSADSSLQSETGDDDQDVNDNEGDDQ